MTIRIKILNEDFRPMFPNPWVIVDGYMVNDADKRVSFRMFIGTTICTIRCWSGGIYPLSGGKMIDDFPRFVPGDYEERKPIKWIGENALTIFDAVERTPTDEEEP